SHTSCLRDCSSHLCSSDLINADSIPFIKAEVEIGQIIRKPVVSDEAKRIARSTIDALRERVMKGEDMGTLAILYSEDPGSARDGDRKIVGYGQCLASERDD